MQIERYHEKILQDPTKARCLKGVLLLLSYIWAFGSVCKNFWYDRMGFVKKKLPIPVISIGNIVAGGTGKTPFIAMLLKELSVTSGVLTRGYRSKKKRAPILVTKDTDPAYAGDEALWLVKKTRAFVFSGKDRIASGKMAADLGLSLALLEDGLQYRKLHREEEIILLDGTDPWGRGYFLPRGYLRDSPAVLKRASLVVITRLETGVEMQPLVAEVRKHTQAPIVGFSSIYTLPSVLVGEKVGAFCGIAKPYFFIEALKKQKVKIVQELFSQDHILPAIEKIEEFAKKCKQLGARALVCTEKDFIKMPIDIDLSLPIYTLSQDLVCTWNEKSWKEIVQSIQNREQIK